LGSIARCSTFAAKRIAKNKETAAELFKSADGIVNNQEYTTSALYVIQMDAQGIVVNTFGLPSGMEANDSRLPKGAGEPLIQKLSEYISFEVHDFAALVYASIKNDDSAMMGPVKRASACTGTK
jgi:hypothetical protein